MFLIYNCETRTHTHTHTHPNRAIEGSRDDGKLVPIVLADGEVADAAAVVVAAAEWLVVEALLQKAAVVLKIIFVV